MLIWGHLKSQRRLCPDLFPDLVLFSFLVARSPWSLGFRGLHPIEIVLSFGFSCGSISLCIAQVSIVMHDYFCSSSNRKPARVLYLHYHVKI